MKVLPVFLALFAIAVLGSAERGKGDEHSQEESRKLFGHLASGLGGFNGGNNGGKDVVVVIDKDNRHKGHRYDSDERRPIIIRQKEKPVHVVAPVLVDRPVHRPQYYRSRERDYSWEYIKRRRHRPQYYESNSSSDEGYKRRKTHHKHKGASSSEEHHHYHYVAPPRAKWPAHQPYWGGWGGSNGWNGGSGWHGGGGWNGGWGGGGKGHGRRSNEDSDSSGGDRGGHHGKGKGNRS